MADSQNERLITIANRLYVCRDQALSLSGIDGFIKIVDKWKPVFQQVMNRDKCSELEALRILLDHAKGNSEEGFLMHQLIAVACELTEPKYTIAKT